MMCTCGYMLQGRIHLYVYSHALQTPAKACRTQLCIKTAAWPNQTAQFQFYVTFFSSGYSNDWSHEFVSTLLCSLKITFWLLMIIITIWHVLCWLSCLSGAHQAENQEDWDYTPCVTWTLFISNNAHCSCLHNWYFFITLHFEC